MDRRRSRIDSGLSSLTILFSAAIQFQLRLRMPGCLFLPLVGGMASTSRSWGWIFGAGMAAAMALLLKLEFGAACYGTLLIADCRAQFSAAYPGNPFQGTC